MKDQNGSFPSLTLVIPISITGLDEGEWKRRSGSWENALSCTWKLNLELKALKVWPSPTFLFLIDNGLECSGSSWPPHAEREHAFIKAKNDLFSLPGKPKWMKPLLGWKVNFCVIYLLMNNFRWSKNSCLEQENKYYLYAGLLRLDKFSFSLMLILYWFYFINARNICQIILKLNFASLELTINLKN